MFDFGFVFNDSKIDVGYIMCLGGLGVDVNVNDVVIVVLDDVLINMFIGLVWLMIVVGMYDGVVVICYDG